MGPRERRRASRGSFVTVSVPRRYADVSERYRTLERHSVAIETNELSLAHSLAEKWRDLYVFARTKDLRLAKVKEDFRAVTTEQSEAFQEELKALRTQFYAEGPIAGKVSLEEGVLSMADYAATLSKCVSKKDELVNAEDLFGAARGVLARSRVHLTMTWVVSFSSLRPILPSRTPSTRHRGDGVVG